MPFNLAILMQHFKNAGASVDYIKNGLMDMLRLHTGWTKDTIDHFDTLPLIDYGVEIYQADSINDMLQANFGIQFSYQELLNGIRASDLIKMAVAKL